MGQGNSTLLRSSSGKLSPQGKNKSTSDANDFVMYNPETWKFCLPSGAYLSDHPPLKKIKPLPSDLGKSHKVFVDFVSLDIYHESNVEPYYCHIPRAHQALRGIIPYNNLKPVYFDSRTEKMFYFQNAGRVGLDIV